jgi:hypothetical protein
MDVIIAPANNPEPTESVFERYTGLLITAYCLYAALVAFIVYRLRKQTATKAKNYTIDYSE